MRYRRGREVKSVVRPEPSGRAHGVVMKAMIKTGVERVRVVTEVVLMPRGTVTSL